MQWRRSRIITSLPLLIHEQGQCLGQITHMIVALLYHPEREAAGLSRPATQIPRFNHSFDALSGQEINRPGRIRRFRFRKVAL